MTEESQLIIDKYNLKKIQETPFPIFSGKIYEKEVLLLQSEIGKVCSASGATHLLEKYKAKKIINIGLAGGLTPDKKIGEVFLIDKVIQHDAYLPENWRKLRTDDFLRSLDLETIEGLETGVCLTGDQFLDNEEKAKELVKIGEIVEMELFAVAQVCKIYGVTCIGIKAISDNATQEARGDFYENLQKSMKNSVELLNKLFQKI